MQGLPGLTGAAGANGAIGANGANGANGAIGATGATGPVNLFTETTNEIMFSIRYAAAPATFVVESTNVLLTNNAANLAINVVIETMVRFAQGHYRLRAHFNSYYMDSDEVVTANYIMRDGGTRVLSMSDLDGNNTLEFVILSGNAKTDLVVGDEIKFTVAWPTVN